MRIAPASAALVLAIAARLPAAEAKDPIAVPLVVHVAPGADAKAVRDDAWIDAQIAEAERLLGPAGLHFDKKRERALPVAMAKLETKDDRDALAGELVKGSLNVMIVASLRDVDDPSRLRMGVHWRPRKALKKHFVIVAASAMPTTLAHELGHYFGLPHDAVTNNLMSYDRDGGAIFVTAAQRKTIAQFAGISVAAKELTGG